MKMKAQKEQNEQTMTEFFLDLNESITYLESLLNDDDNKLVIFDTDSNSYTPSFNLCVMNLLSFGVGVHHVNNVIKSVGNLCGKTIDHFASVRTINRIGDQRLSISYKQMVELKDEESTTLMSDETRKQGDVYEIFAVRDQTGKNWVLGLKEMVNKSSQSCLDTLKSIINDIDISSTTKFGQHILCNIKNTMSDRAASEKHFHDLLETYRQ